MLLNHDLDLGTINRCFKANLRWKGIRKSRLEGDERGEFGDGKNFTGSSTDLSRDISSGESYLHRRNDSNGEDTEDAVATARRVWGSHDS